MNFHHFAPYLYAGIVWGILSFFGVLLMWKFIHYAPARRGWTCYKCGADVPVPNLFLSAELQVCDRCWEKRIGLS